MVHQVEGEEKRRVREGLCEMACLHKAADQPSQMDSNDIFAFYIGHNRHMRREVSLV